MYNMYNMRKTRPQSQCGFTLTEVVVVSVVAGLLGVGIVTMLAWMFGTSQDDQMRAHLQTNSNIVLEELARKVHVSSRVISSADSSTLQFVTGGIATGTMSFAGDTLKQNGNPFKVAGYPVLIQSDSSFFGADTSGNFVNTQLVLRRDNARFTLHTGILRCRN